MRGQEEFLRELCRRAARRLDLWRAVHGATRWLPAGLALSAAVYIPVRLGLLDLGPYTLLPLVAPPLFVLLRAVVQVLLSRSTSLHGALLLDRRAGLKERLTAALERLEGGEERGPMERALLRDAYFASRVLDLRRLVPIRPSKRAVWALLPTAAMLGSWLFLGPLPGSEAMRRKAFRETAKAEAQRLERLAEEVRKHAEGRRRAEMLQLARDLEGLARKLRAFRTTKREALREMHELARKIARQQGARARRALDGLSKAASSLNPSKLRSADLREFARLLRGLDLEGASKVLRNLERRLKEGRLSQAGARKLADDLERAAKALRGTCPKTARKLEEAARSLRSGRCRSAGNCLKGACEALSEEMGSDIAYLAAVEVATEGLEEAKAVVAYADMACPYCHGTGKVGGKPCSHCGGTGFCGLQGASCASKAGVGGSEWGRGSANKGGRGGRMAGPTGAKHVAKGRRPKRRGKYEPLYRPERAAVRTRDVHVKSGARGRAVAEEPDLPVPEPVRTPLFEASLEEARQRAEREVEREKVPLRYRRVVKSYFEALTE